MAKANNTITVVPVSRFKWTAQIQYKESFFTQDEAIRYASENDCNLVVQYKRRSGPLFDALHDPNLVSTSKDASEMVEVVPALAESESTGRSKRMLQGAFGLAKRLGTAATTWHREKSIPSVPSQALAVK